MLETKMIPPHRPDLVGWAIYKSLQEKTDSRKFHVIEKDEHYFVRVDFSPEENTGTYEKYTFEQVQLTFEGAPKTEDVFMRSISKFPCIKIKNSPSSQKTLEAPKKLPCIETKTPSPISYEYRKATYAFSQEIQNALQGKREEDHSLPIELLQKCISKKHTRMVKEALKGQNKRFDFYFYDQAKGRILNFIIDFFPSSQYREQLNFNVITAYYPTRSILKHRLGFNSDATYETWFNERCKV